MRSIVHLTAFLLFISASLARPTDSQVVGDTLEITYGDTSDGSAESTTDTTSTDTSSSSVVPSSSTTATPSASSTIVAAAASSSAASNSTTTDAQSSKPGVKIPLSETDLALGFKSHGAGYYRFLNWDKAKRATAVQDSTFPPQEGVSQLNPRDGEERDTGDAGGISASTIDTAIPTPERDRDAMESLASGKRSIEMRRSTRRRRSSAEEPVVQHGSAPPRLDNNIESPD